MPTSESDLALAERVCRDRKAFDALFDRYADRVYALARSRTESDEQAEGLTGEMLEEVFGELASFRGESALDVWVVARCQSVLRAREASGRRMRAAV